VKLLLISQYYWPESFGAGEWTTELAEWLYSRGHEVCVLTAFPNYPDGIVFPEYRGRIFQQEVRNGVRIVRTWFYATPRTRSIWQRVLSQVSFSVTLLLGLLAVGSPDVIWYCSPPLPGTISAWLLARAFGAAFVLNVSDIEPERSVALALFRNRALISILNAVERFAYRQADRICVLSKYTADHLAEKGVPAAKLLVTPAWANAAVIRPLLNGPSLREELGIADHEFVVLYSGNMGYTMGDLETVVKAARSLAEKQDIRFILAGDGVRRKHLEGLAAGLNNVMFLPIQSRERYARLLNAADACVVTLSREGTTASVPSKTYSIMAAGKPVLAICEPANEIARLVRQEDCGVQTSNGDVQALVKAIQYYAESPAVAHGQGIRGQSCFERYHTPIQGMSTYEEVFAQLCSGPIQDTVAAAASKS
jgi:colanic acid biosynthesis glycosyl transferase WcaI